MHLEQYKRLIDDFVTAKIEVNVFECRYLESFKRDSFGDMPEYEILNELFLDIDAFHEDPKLRKETGLDEHQLRRKAQTALDKLEVLK
jgi:hypothetical protein